MMYTHTYKRGVTLVEMLVVIAILSLVLAGIYGLLNSAYQSYNHSRAKLESQQTARAVMDYLVYRLREIDGGSVTKDPKQCTDCHKYNMDNKKFDNLSMPCPEDVSIPQKAPAILNISTIPLTTLAGVPAGFQNMDGNYIQFKADLLPLHGFSESFTDDNGNGVWDFNDEDGDGKYDYGETELLLDMNDNTRYDYFGEIWTFELQASQDGPYFELVESLNFTSLSPRSPLTPAGRLKYNKSIYPDTGYQKVPVAYGLTGLSIKKVPRSLPATGAVSSNCAQNGNPSANPTACHGSGATGTGPLYGRSLNVYGAANNISYANFTATHPWWNVGGLSIEVTTTSTRGAKQQFTKLQEFVILRNLEINQ